MSLRVPGFEFWVPDVGFLAVKVEGEETSIFIAEQPVPSPYLARPE